MEVGRTGAPRDVVVVSHCPLRELRRVRPNDRGDRMTQGSLR